MKAKYILLTVATCFLLSGCNYLDIVPDERNTPEDMYQNPEAARQYLYACYSKIPKSRTPEHLDKYSAGEVCFAMEKNEFQTFPRGYYSPISLSITQNYYNNIWQGIRCCYEFLQVIDLVPDMVEEDLIHYKAEATFLIAYYHFLLLRAYGPVPVIREALDPNADADSYPERSSIDEVVEFIDEKIAEALPGLATSFSGQEYGRFTRYAALALQARMHLYIASPLFNGNSQYYADFKSKLDGRHLISQTESREKWETAEELTRKAIIELKDAGYRLYNSNDAGAINAAKPALPNTAQRTVRYTILDNKEGTNPELIMVDTRAETQYEIQNQSCPRQNEKGHKNAYNSCAPTLQIVELFYTKNGLPIEEDTEFDYPNRYNIVTMPNNYDGNSYGDPKGKTLKLHLDREPRFYAWIGFHNGYFEIAKYNGSNTGGNKNDKKAIQLKMLSGQAQGMQANNDANYSSTGYLNKKFFHPAFQNGLNADTKYAYPIIRMTELYLNYAEILIELGGEDNLNTAKEYIDEVRTRAGIPTIDEAWKKAKNPAKANTQEGLREIVRHERQIEFYLENQRFWDLRRWKQAEILGEKVKGLNIYGKTEEEFFHIEELKVIRSFKQAQYLMPIPQTEINKCPQWVQNPGY